MRKAWTPAPRWVFLVATLLGLFSTAQAYRLTTLNPKAHIDGIDLGSLLVLNLTLLVRAGGADRSDLPLRARFRLDADRWLRALGDPRARPRSPSRSCTARHARGAR